MQIKYQITKIDALIATVKQKDAEIEKLNRELKELKRVTKRI